MNKIEPNIDTTADTAVETKANIEDLYKALSTSEKAFIDIYLNNGYNAYKACKQTTKNPNRTDGAIRVKAVRLLQSQNVKAYLSEYFEQIRLDNKVEVNKLIEELNRLAFIEYPSKEQVPLKKAALELLHKTYGLEKKASLSITDNEGKVIKVEYC